MLGFGPLRSRLTASVDPLARSQPDDRLLEPIRQAARRLPELPHQQLIEEAERVRQLVCQETVDGIRPRIEAFALMFEALRRARRIELYDVQLLAALALARGVIAEMQTGEGKTFSCAPAAFLHSLTGRGVHVATPNSYLAERDCELLLPAYRMLGTQVGRLPEQGVESEKQLAYRCDITYGTGYEFGFDYLRDQLTLQKASSRELGASLLESLVYDDNNTSESLLQRGLYFAIVDEADNVLLDDAASPLILSSSAQGEAADAEVHRAALRVVGGLTPREHYLVEAASSRVSLTEAGAARVHSADQQIPIEKLRRTWSEYVEQALRAAELRRDVHYVLDDEDTVQIVDTGTGRIFTDRTWSDGLHQAVEAKEDVCITCEKHALAQITRQRFSRLYERLAGMTGTATGCEREFRQVYRLGVVPIPLRTESRRELWPVRYFVNRRIKWNAIADSVAEIHSQRRPVLVGTGSIAESEALAESFTERGLEFQLLNGRQDATEAAIVAAAGGLSVITIATSLAGRGTDIKLARGVTELGGLHVVVSQCDDSARVDRQMIGRSGRQGDPGSAQLFVSAEDPLIVRHGPWLAASMARHAGPDGELRANLSRQVGRLQRCAERAAYSSRCALLRRDLARDSLYSRQPLDP
jgi:preprotein translocase subunit SecA